MARVFLGRRSRGLYFLPWVMESRGNLRRVSAIAKAAPALELSCWEGTGKCWDVTDGRCMAGLGRRVRRHMYEELYDTQPGRGLSIWD